MRQRRHLQCLVIAISAAIPGFSALAAPFSLPPIGEWQGVYKCAQGNTALDLEITAETPSRISAIFYFHALAANPHLPQGCFTMRGSFDADMRSIALRPAQWLDHPAFFVSVGLNGKVSASGQRLTGSVTGPACTAFSLTRSFAEPLPPAPAPCHFERQGPVS
jgi:hypothetical protein